ncbi:Vacuolar protein sorting-associated protein 11 -like protein [Trametes pubescens]|uniref:Vacuolar protein sorting-associated protein 11-like protein n=1 Tax=Trametes pubescens TaxID=154538 RepID=A0A1M2V3X1_TRAPU|nr:Vacuolar protein sorting-associated protein 11 -like protein [Trametes pubescens]
MELPFDLDTAICVCCQAGYFEHASYLAKKYERHEDYLRIQIEDAGNYKDALTYLRRLGAEAAESNLARYGCAMLDNSPDETTDLLIDICTSLTPLSVEADEEEAAPATQSGGGTSYLSYLALNRASAAESNAQTNRTKAPEPIARQDSAHAASQTSTPPPATPTTATAVKQLASSVKCPSPRLYFAHFVDHPQHFVRFLETVSRKRWGQTVENISEPLAVEADPDADVQAEARDQAAVWNTLFELYLAQPGDDDAKALAVLQNMRLPYDPTHALILCSTRSYTPGLVLLWERMGMQEDVLWFFMDRDQEGKAGASGEVVRRLDQYGPGRPQLYPLVLRFLTSTPALLAKHREDVRRVLRVIDEEKLMPPVSVVQVLSRNSVASVGLVKEWLMLRIKSVREEVDMDQKLIASYRTETEAKLRQVEELSDPDHLRVFHVTQYSACQGGLDLPAVHFMCNHSYHQQCLPQNEMECPNCAREHGIVREIRRNNERLADQHELFLSEVREGGFDALSTGFSRGVLNLSRVEETGSL